MTAWYLEIRRRVFYCQLHLTVAFSLLVFLLCDLAYNKHITSSPCPDALNPPDRQHPPSSLPGYAAHTPSLFSCANILAKAA